MEAAGCRNCHNTEGVASATRLHFPDKNTPLPRIEMFGNRWWNWLTVSIRKNRCCFRSRQRASRTRAVSEFQNSPEEAVLKTWVEYLAKLSGPELERAKRYKQEEEAGYGVVPAVLRRLTNSQYNNTVRDLLGNMLSPADGFPPEDFVNGFKNQYQALPVSPLLTEAYSEAAEKLAADAFRRGDFHGLIPCKPTEERRQLPYKIYPESLADAPSGVRWSRRKWRATALFSAQREDVPERRCSGGRSHAAIADFIFWMEQTPNPAWKAYATASFLSYSLWNTMPDDLLRCGGAWQTGDSSRRGAHGAPHAGRPSGERRTGRVRFAMAALRPCSRGRA